MKKILLGFIAIGLLTFVGCKKEKQKGCTEPNAINYDSVAEVNDGSCEYTETGSDEGTTDDSSIKYGEGVTDIDGHTYKTVIIGEQEWMSENLRTSKFSDGTSIINVVGNSSWENLIKFKKKLFISTTKSYYWWNGENHSIRKIQMQMLKILIWDL